MERTVEEWGGAPVSEATEPASATTSNVHVRTNSRRGHTNPTDRSYPPVMAVLRALHVLKAVNSTAIATINSIHRETGIPRPTIVRMLETLMHEGYVVRDNMCGGYRVTGKVAELSAGYSGISRVIEVARPLAVGLTRKIKWPIGLGEIDGDEIEIRYWTGTISPVVHTNTVLGKRPDLLRSAMGRVYMAFCPDEERDRQIALLRRRLGDDFNQVAEDEYRGLLGRIRQSGFATRDPGTEPTRMTTFGVPILDGDSVAAVMSVSFFTSSVPLSAVRETVLEPLIETRLNIEHALAFISTRPHLDAGLQREYDVSL
ncbi:helix-turn-helix domain-containing protein [Devosia albogilva]|uniref:Helix-turn-helix domain-containing protein n=1 Tax=Devosia albogilva TaxID=429726 RepID=A0ABW5QP14_9HYPH